jgi:hypothetical protein
MDKDPLDILCTFVAQRKRCRDTFVTKIISDNSKRMEIQIRYGILRGRVIKINYREISFRIRFEIR